MKEKEKEQISVTLKQLKAEPDPKGNGIILSFIHPDPEKFPCLKIIRTTGEYAQLKRSEPLRLNKPEPRDEFIISISDINDKNSGFRTRTNEKGETLYYYIDSVSDESFLKGETVYYYSLFPYKKGETPAPSEHDIYNRTAAMAISPQGIACVLYKMLPAIYKRYDAKEGECLKRLLEIAGRQFDVLFSYARSMLGLHHIQSLDGSLLPLLASWIGWDTDHKRGYNKQRNEIRFAPYYYRTLGTIPTAEATVKRVVDWDSHTKEFVYNIAMSNQPSRLNLWMAQQGHNKQEHEDNLPFLWPDELKSLVSTDWAYEGRSSVITEQIDQAHYKATIFYHAENRLVCAPEPSAKLSRPAEYTEDLYWSIRSKEFHWFRFKLDKGAEDLENLDSGIISRSIRTGMAEHGFSLSGNCEVRRTELSDNKEETLQQWIISDLDAHHSFMLYPLNEKSGPDPQEEAHVIEIHHWAPSERITYGGFYDRHPSATTINDQTLIFWDRFIEQAGDFSQRWCICFVVRNEKLRTRIYEFASDKESNSGLVERKSPFALTNPSGDLCLFWLERRNGGPWKLVFKQFSIPADTDPADTAVEPDPDAIANSITPEDPIHMPVFDRTRIEYDIFVLFEKTKNKRFKVWLFWAQYETVVPGEDYQFTADSVPNGQWCIYYTRTKNEVSSIPESKSAWQDPLPIRDYAGVPGGDREPAAIYIEDTDKKTKAVCIEDSDKKIKRIELYWRSHGYGNPRIWKSVYSPELSKFKRPVLVTGGSESDFAPLPILLNGKRFLIYRSTRSIKHTSRLYSATQTCDISPSGSVVVDKANSVAMALMGHFEDFHTYTYDTGCSFKDGAFTPRSEKSRYARDTIGIYLSPESDEVGDYLTNFFILSQVLRKFLPIQVRPVFFVEPKPDIESVYEEGEKIGEHCTDTYFTRVIYDQVRSKHCGHVPEWKVFHSQIRKEGKLPYKNHKTVDTRIEQVDLSYKTAHTGIDMGEDK